MINAFVLLLTSITFAQTPAPKNSAIICEKVYQSPIKITKAEYTHAFADKFRKSVPHDQLTSALGNYIFLTGGCVSSSVKPAGPGQYLMTMTTTRKFTLTFSLHIEEKTDLIDGFYLKSTDDPMVKIKSWDDVTTVLANLDREGQLSAALVSPDLKLDLKASGETPLAIGSTFKLYVLGALAKSIQAGQHTWNDPLAIRDEWKSTHGSGATFADKKAGEKLKLFEYAMSMISISDNTATDHLLYFLGRSKVESQLAPMGNHHEKLNTPFLATNEMFKLKWGVKPAQTEAYIKANVPTRRETLEELESFDLDLVLAKIKGDDGPSHNDTLEWFATNPELCQAMFWLAEQKGPEIRQILSKNVPNVPNPEHWAYMGYKGGSEPGVMSMTYLLESKKGKRACMSMTWNSKHGFNETRFVDITSKILKFAETQIP